MLSKTRQIQTIADLLKGYEPPVDRVNLEPVFQWLWDVMTEASQGDRYRAMAQLEADPDNADIAWLLREIMRTTPGERPKHIPLADLANLLPVVNWLWKGWIARGYLTLMAAFPGVGKTYAALDLAHRLISQQPGPDGEPLQVRNPVVVYVDAEDFLPVVSQRATAWGMNTRNFYPLQRPPRSLIDMNQIEYQDMLVDMCHDLQPDLVIVDSLSSVNAKGENSIEDLREVLSFFAEIPAAFDCGLVLIHHLRKPGKGLNQGITMHDLRGSGHLVAMARVILGLDVINPDDPNGPRVMKTLKNNLSRHPQPLGLTMEPTADPDVAKLAWGNASLFMDDKETDVGIAADWLADVLAKDGAQAWTELATRLSAELGFNDVMLHRARKELGSMVVDTVGSRKRGNKWALRMDDNNELEPEQ